MKKFRFTYNFYTNAARRILVSFLAITILIMSVMIVGASNTYPCSGVVTSDNGLNVRSGPGATYSRVSGVGYNETVTVLEEARATDNVRWYKINYDAADTSKTGFVIAEFVYIKSTPSDSGDMTNFENYLNSQGFPESYKTELRTLHQQYPSWVFVAQPINIDFNTVVVNQNVLGRSLVSAKGTDAHKSYEPGAYDWDEGIFKQFDTGWVQASSEAVSYALDPRNFLNDSHVFMFEKLSYSDNHTAPAVASILKGTFMNNAYPTSEVSSYTDAFLKAAKSSGVSANLLASRARQEQGVSGNQLAHGTVPGYEGYYNFFNIKASASQGNTAVLNGAIYAKGSGSFSRPWDSAYKSILGGAHFLGDGYINREQDTLYLQKFDVTNGGNGYYWHQYMSNVFAPRSEAIIMKRAYSEAVLNSAIIFKIPVYNNMPQETQKLPSSNGNNNYYLNNLAVNGYPLTPNTFDKFTTSYELVVPNLVSNVTVTATTCDLNASIRGNGLNNLAVGNNIISIVVTATNGISRTYTINIFRQDGTTGDGNSPVIETTVYNVSDIITGVALDTPVATFIANLKVTNGEVKIYDKNGNLRNGNIGTGDKVKIYSGTSLYAEYPVVIYGDISGDGKINVFDLAAVQKHLLAVSTLNGAQFRAADSNKSGSINVFDLAALQKHLLGVSSIKQ